MLRKYILLISIYNVNLGINQITCHARSCNALKQLIVSAYE